MVFGKNKPKISVILPVYNAGAFIKDSVGSILNQSVKDFELIVLDDCSTDNTLEIIEQFGDPRIVIHRNERNLGLTKTLNIGLQLAESDYIARMDADDISHEHRFFFQLRAMEQNPQVCVCGTSYQQIGAGSNKVIRDSGHDNIKGKILLRAPFAHPFVMFRAKFFKQNDIQYDENLPCAQDYALWLRLAHEYEDCHFENLLDIFGYYRLHREAISGKNKAIQRKIASSARIPYLKALCGDVTEREIKIHDALYINEYNILKPEDLISTKIWLLKLRDSNMNSDIYAQHFFNLCLAEKFRDVCMSCLWLGEWVVKQMTLYPDFNLINVSRENVKYLKEMAIYINKKMIMHDTKCA